MARKNGSGFKMKRSPAKGLSNFFSTLGRKGTEERQKKQTQENQGMTNFEKRRAEKKSRKAGESKYQADIRRKQEERKAKNKAKKADKPRTDILTKNIKDTSQKGDEAVRPKKTTVTNKPKSKAKSTKPDWSKAPKVGTTARTNWYKKFNLALDETTPGYKEKTKTKLGQVDPETGTVNVDYANYQDYQD